MVDVLGKNKRRQCHMFGLREGDLSREKWAKFSFFHLILQQTRVVKL
jgi:hypothetical protein